MLPDGGDDDGDVAAGGDDGVDDDAVDVGLEIQYMPVGHALHI